jgi:hypothetical protein
MRKIRLITIALTSALMVCRRPIMRNVRLVTMLTLVGGGLLLGPEAASAQTCIQDVWKAHGNKQNLTCTANDVTLSSATNINITTGGSCAGGVCSCFAGQTVTFTADFRMDLTADTRYDVGFYIATDGDPNHDGAITGTCSANASLTTNTAAANFVNLDAAPDVCGEIEGPSGSAHNPLFVTATISAQCPGTAGQKLQLPFATTWRQPGSNEVCDGTGVNNGTTTNDVFPGAPSKCNQGTLVLDITSVSTTLNVTKTANTASVPETGGSASYTVRVDNTSAIAVTLTSLSDNQYSDITAVGGAVTATTCVPDASAATCEVGGTIAAGGNCSCAFTANVPAGDVPGNFVDVVQACANNTTNPTEVCGTDDAEVPYTDVSSAPTLVKTAAATSCIIDQTYDVVVTNGSAFETLTLNTLNDDIFGSITQVQGGVRSTTCGQTPGPGLLPATIPAAGNYACSFVGRSTTCSGTVVDKVTGGTTDEDGVPFSPFDTATVVISVTTDTPTP